MDKKKFIRKWNESLKQMDVDRRDFKPELNEFVRDFEKYLNEVVEEEPEHY